MPELSALLDFLFLASREKIEQRSQGHWYRRICRDLKHRTVLLFFFNARRKEGIQPISGSFLKVVVKYILLEFNHC